MQKDNLRGTKALTTTISRAKNQFITGAKRYKERAEIS